MQVRHQPLNEPTDMNVDLEGACPPVAEYIPQQQRRDARHGKGGVELRKEAGGSGPQLQLRLSYREMEATQSTKAMEDQPSQSQHIHAATRIL